MVNELDAAQLISNKGAYSVVDVRGSRFFAAGTAEGAINVPMNPQTGKFGEGGLMTEAEAKEALAALPKDKPVAVMCYHGYLSQFAAQYLSDQGYDASSVRDGYEGYKAALAQRP